MASLPSDENVKVDEDGSSDWGSWAVALEVKRRVWNWDWDESVVRNLGFLLSELRVLVISELAIDWDFYFCWLWVLLEMCSCCC